MVVHCSQCVLNECMVFFSAEENANGWVVGLFPNIFIKPTDICIELTNILVVKFFELQIDKHMTLQNAMIKNKINEVVFVAY